MPNFDGIHELRGYYTTIPTGMVALEHRVTMDVQLDDNYPPGTPMSAISTVLHSGIDGTLQAWCDLFVAEWVNFYPAEASFSRFELWSIPEGTHDGFYVTTYEVAEVGINPAASTPAQQDTWTFRSVGGGYARLQLMETSSTTTSKISPPYPTVYADIAQLMIGTDSPVLARDNTRIFANLKYSGGQNEKLWRKRFRS